MQSLRAASAATAPISALLISAATIATRLLGKTAMLDPSYRSGPTEGSALLRYSGMRRVGLADWTPPGNCPAHPPRPARRVLLLYEDHFLGFRAGGGLEAGRRVIRSYGEHV